MTKRMIFLLFILLLGLNSCIQEDIVNDTVPDEIRIISNVNSLKAGDIVKLEASYFNNVGQKENKTIVWESSNLNVLFINNITTNITAEAEGTATITATTIGVSGELSDQQIIRVVSGDVIIPPT